MRRVKLRCPRQVHVHRLIDTWNIVERPAELRDHDRRPREAEVIGNIEDFLEATDLMRERELQTVGGVRVLARGNRNTIRVRPGELEELAHLRTCPRPNLGLTRRPTERCPVESFRDRDVGGMDGELGDPFRLFRVLAENGIDEADVVREGLAPPPHRSRTCPRG